MTLSNIHLNLAKAISYEPPVQDDILTDPEDFYPHILRQDWAESGRGYMSVGYVPNPEQFSRYDDTDGYIDIRALPIKAAGSRKVIIPQEIYDQYGQAAISIVDHRFARPGAMDMHAVLHLQRNYVRPQSSQRGASGHTDDVDKVLSVFNDVSQRISHDSYIVSDVFTTLMQKRPVRDASVVFNGKSLSVHEGSDLVQKLAPHEIARMNKYTYHGGVFADQGSIRSFLAIMFVPTKAMEQKLSQGAYRAPERDKSALHWDGP